MDVDERFLKKLHGLFYCNDHVSAQTISWWRICQWIRVWIMVANWGSDEDLLEEGRQIPNHTAEVGTKAATQEGQISGLKQAQVEMQKPCSAPPKARTVMVATRFTHANNLNPLSCLRPFLPQTTLTGAVSCRDSRQCHTGAVSKCLVMFAHTPHIC